MSAGDELAEQLLDLLPVGLVVWRLVEPKRDSSLALVYANRWAAQLTGNDLRAWIGRSIDEVFLGSSPDRIKLIADCCRDGTKRSLGRFSHRGPTAQVAEKFAGNVVPLGDQRVLVVLESVNTLDRAEGEARSVNNFLDSIIEHLPAMVFVKDAHDLRFQRFNRAGEELLGVPRAALIAKNDYDLFPSEQADVFVRDDRDVLASRALKDIPREPIETPRGTRWLHTRKIPILDELGAPRYLLGVSIDVTDQKSAEEVLRSAHEELEQRVQERTAELQRQVSERMRAEEALARTEEQLRQAQKMEAIGRLAGGIAHDFNNLLSVVLGYSDLIMQQLPGAEPGAAPGAEPVRRHVEQITLAGERAAELTRQLLAFSRRQVLKPRTVNLNDILGNVNEMLTRLVGEDIELSILPAADLAFTKADPSQIEQVIMNLLVNARDAMPRGGKLTIETNNVELDATFIADHLGAVQGPHVMLSVSDTGIGMDKQTQARIFEPFFTTKETGKGTGLGLSMVFGIVRQSGGLVWVYSEPNCGATFKVYLPAVHAPVDAPPTLRAAPVDLHGSETILLVEDEQQVRVLAVTCLRQLGYRVIEARDVADALDRARQEGSRIQLLLTDVVMPGMGGRELAEQVRALIPELRVLYMSGYTDDAIVRHGVLELGVPFLQKPFTPPLLALRTREALDAPRPHSTAIRANLTVKIP